MMLALLLTLAAAPQADADGDTLTPARQGLLRCTAPSRTRKTCASLTQFTVRADGSFDAEVTGVAVPGAGIQVRYRMAGMLVAGAACFTQEANALAGATFTKPGARLAPSLQDSLRSQLAGSMRPLIGKQRCYRDRIQGGELVSRTTLDGVAHPEFDRPVLWVSPEDGYKVE
jgi:hypothetical protein